MFLAGIFLFFLTSGQTFDINGQLVGSARQSFHHAEIESVDHRFIDYGEVDSAGRFSFKRVPEGMYNVIVTNAAGRTERRNIEVCGASVDARGKLDVEVKVETKNLPEDELKIGAATLGVSPKAKEELRKARLARGDIEKTRQHLQKAIDISPNFDEALNNLGTLYFNDGNYEQAKKLFERALAANPNLFAAQVNLGSVLISLGDYNRGLEENLKAVAMRPGDSLAQSQTGQALFFLNRYDEALSHLKESERIDPVEFTAPGLFIAQIFQLRGETAAAIAEYSAFLKTHPGSPLTGLAQRHLAILEKR